METELTGTHRTTYDAVFQHPIARNLAWRDVRLSDFANLSVTGQRVSNPPPLFRKPVAA